MEREFRKIRYQSLIVDDARRAAGRDGDRELTYGTTTPRLATRILLDILRVEPEDVFYDLGCGLGAPTLVAALYCKRATGIDILPILDHPRGAARKLGLRNAKFISGDFRAQDFRDGTAFYSYSTCFSAQTRAALAEKLCETRPGTRIATVTHALKHPGLEFIDKITLRWGLTPHAVFLHLRR